MATSRLCSIPDCGKIARKRDYCQLHHDRYLRPADPFGRRVPRGTALRFFHEVALPYEGNDCLTWPLSTTKGYGQIRYDDRPQLVSRLVCAHVHGPAPTPDHQAAHSCGRGKFGCVTKRHLSWKTQVENEADKLIHGTSPRGEKSGTSKLTASNVLEIRALAGTMLHREIAAKFGIERRTVGHIIERHIWAWLQYKPPTP